MCTQVRDPPYLKFGETMSIPLTDSARKIDMQANRTATESRPHILIVDDDTEILDLVDHYLTEEGFRVSRSQDGHGMRQVFDQGDVDLVILDVRLKGEDGLILAADLRQRNSETGIVILSRKDEVVDRVVGLELGADDYLAKPFHLRELLARVRSVLRRCETRISESQRVVDGVAPAIYRFGGWQMNSDSRELRSPSGQPVRLSSGEFDLLQVFLANANKALSRDRLLDLARGREAALFDRSIDVLVGRLRRKIEEDPRRPRMIKTIRGAGYMLNINVTHE